MRRMLLFALLITAIWVGACAAPPPATDFANPVVSLKRVEVQSYFAPPWTGWPAAPPTPTPPPAGTPAAQYVPFPGSISVPMVLAFVWDINNPNDAAVTLEQLKFSVELEAAPMKPGEYFALNTPIAYEKQTIPGKTTNQVRVVTVLDSAVVPGALAVAYGQRIGTLGLSGAALVQNWWTNIGDFKFGVRASGGTADFTSGPNKKTVPFEGKFPK